MLLFIAAIATVLTPAVRTGVEATARIRVERPGIANHDVWEHSASSARKDIVIRDERGQTVHLRIIEYQ